MSKFSKFLSYAATLMIGVSIGCLVNKILNNKDIEQVESKNSEVNYSDKYPHINPLKFCDTAVDNPINNKIKPLKDEVEKIANSSDTKVAVYYRNLNNGPWFIVNPDYTFYGRSLLKVPVVIAYLKVAEQNPNILNNSLTYNGETPQKQNLPAEKSIHVGETYTMEDLIKHTLIYSDNLAVDLLANELSFLGLSNKLEETYSELSLNYDNGEVNVKEYSEMMRILYNSTYLNKDFSEAVLNILSNSDYKSGLVSGFPAGTEVANKFGIKDEPGEENDRQLHDCGIVYLNNGAHLICVMTKGDSIKNQEAIIQKIAKTIAKVID